MVSERVPLTILNNLIHDEEFTRKVIPFIENDYFEERSDKQKASKAGCQAQDILCRNHIIKKHHIGSLLTNRGTETNK